MEDGDAGGKKLRTLVEMFAAAGGGKKEEDGG